MDDKELVKMRDAMEKNCSQDYILRQMAEEYSEVAHAALKLIRALHCETPTTESEAISNLVEEIADADIMRDVFFGCSDPNEISGYTETRNFKFDRTWRRINGMRTEV